MKENSFNYKVLAIFIFGFGLLMFERGFFWAKEQSTVLRDSDFYIALHQVMPIWLWGVLGMIFSLFIILAPVFLPKQQISNKFNFLLILGGSGNAIYYFLLTSASIFNAINWLTPVQFATLAMINALIAFNGGADVARKR
ncbi:hypothetical protein HMPREF2664_07480 [Staphylococcus sp. HMSC064E03]|uniref:hypothetical protein n=1 Tax=Staphylococcus sp. HMSC064E03 TaxID=1715143 RepID=UPI0008A84BF0|nr:hypothetical protein [Staphylococcus sp. HMSC064E03]OHQ07871.1 hypothetical protein HMPREF2664_07480 [Staphylococcus sp. HMSC064E03]